MTLSRCWWWSGSWMMPPVGTDSLRLPFFLVVLDLIRSALGGLEPWDGREVDGDDEDERGSTWGIRAKLGCGVVQRSREGLLAVITGY